MPLKGVVNNTFYYHIAIGAQKRPKQSLLSLAYCRLPCRLPCVRNLVGGSITMSECNMF